MGHRMGKLSILVFLEYADFVFFLLGLLCFRLGRLRVWMRD
jgi:hypothetical protein